MANKTKLCGICSCFVAAGFVYFGNLADEFSIYLTSAFLAFSAVIALLPKRTQDDIVCRLAGLKWTKEELCHGVLITGGIGAGKTVGLLNLVDQLFRSCKDFGALWLDAKGSSHKDLYRLAKKHGREGDVIMVEVDFEGKRIYPKQTMNLITSGGMSSEIIAEIIADIASQHDGKSKNASFFRSQTVQHVSKAIDFLKELGKPVTFRSLSEFLTDPYEMQKTLKSMGGSTEVDPDGKEYWKYAESPWVEYWWTKFLRQAPEQLSGVLSSISNALDPFLTEAVEKVFSPADGKSTVDFNSVNDGKMICIVVPSIYPRQKAAIHQFIKSLFFYTGKRRADLQKFGNQKNNLLVCMLDEYQRCAAAADLLSFDTLRESSCAFFVAMQDELSLVPVVGKDTMIPIVGKFRNRMFFHPESYASAEAAADRIGKTKRWKSTFSSGRQGGSTSRSETNEHIILPQYINAIKNHRCIMLHTNGARKKNIKFKLV